MTYFRSEDIDTLLADFGVPVVVDGVTTFGIVDRTEDEILAGAGVPAMATTIRVVVKTGALAVATGKNVTVDGEALYAIGSVRRIEDGALTEITCLLKGS